MGRLCLETGRKTEALEFFNKVTKMLKESSKPNSPEKDPLTNILETDGDEEPHLAVLSYMNKYVNPFYDL